MKYRHYRMMTMDETLNDEGLQAHGSHVFVDCLGYVSPFPSDGTWILQMMQEAVRLSEVREVHSHVVEFDGSVSPPGFAAMVLIDESHVSAHCYSDRGWLALDSFTCGGTDADGIMDNLLKSIISKIPTLRIVRRDKVDRFLHEDQQDKA